MKLVKTFDTTELGEYNLFDDFYESVQPYFIEDGVTIYCVNGYLYEYDNASKKEKLDYPRDDLERARKLDNFFIERGASKDEEIFVYHGNFTSIPWYK